MPRIRMRDRRAGLVEAALRVMDRDGLSGTTTRAVVGEAGMSLASFHYAYTSRDELIKVVVAKIIAEIDAHDWPSVDPDVDPDEALVTGVIKLLEAQLADPGRAAVLADLVATCPRSAELAGSGVDLTAARQRAMVRWAETWATTCRRSWTPPVDQVARLVLAALDGVVAQWLIERDGESARATMAVFGGSLGQLSSPVATEPDAA